MHTVLKGAGEVPRGHTIDAAGCRGPCVGPAGVGDVTDASAPDDGHGYASSGADGAWTRLWNSLVALVRRWGKQVCDAEDIASEAIARALERLGRAVPWRDLWAWAVRTARSLFVELWRLKERERVEDVDVEALVEVDRAAAQTVLTDMCGRLEQQLCGGERKAFRMLLVGANVAVAASACGVKNRTMRAYRTRIRDIATRAIGKES